MRATAVSWRTRAAVAWLRQGSRSLGQRSSAPTRTIPASTSGGTPSKSFPGPSKRASWDVVVSFEVIEHLLEPRALLRGAHSALVPGGALAVSTPYHGLVKNLGIAAFRFDSHFGVDGEHVRFFTDKALRVS